MVDQPFHVFIGSQVFFVHQLFINRSVRLIVLCSEQPSCESIHISVYNIYLLGNLSTLTPYCLYVVFIKN